MIAEELVTLLGVELSPGAKEKLQAFDKGLDAVVSRVKQASVVLTAAAGGMALYFSNAVNGAADLQRLSDTTGVSTTKLQEWAYAANAMGVSASAVQSDLAKMEKQARWTGRTLESYANQFKGMDAATANIWGDAYGLSPETVLLLRQGADGIAKLKAEAHDVGAIIPPETVKRASEFKAQVVQITTMIRGMATTIALAALPQAERLVATFKGWISENREWIRLGIGKIIEGMGTAFERVWKAGKRLLDWIKDALGPVGDFFQKINKGVDWSKLLTGALVLLLAVFAPLIAKVVLIGAAFAVASAIVEEFLSFLEGKDSVIGRFLKDFEERFPALFELFKKMGTFLKNDLVDKLESISDLMGKILDIANKLVEASSKIAEGAAEYLGIGPSKEEKEQREQAYANAGKAKKEGDGFFSDDPVWRADYQQKKENSSLDKPSPPSSMSTQKEGEGGKAVQPVSLQPVEKSTTPEFHQKDEKKQLVSPVLLENINALADQLAVYSRQRTGMQTSLEGQSVIRMPQKNGPTISDNRSFTVYQTITPSDPQQAADMSAKSFKDIAQIVTPGMNAPVVY
ncbi:hypothetical protein [Bilophila wadsworthia]|uniref:hypothetical protein n=2 Tax=Bilophila wadsworthia TaxID=35833 RepID=UPI00242AE728|nr:hypothetical protein [Bilophila wadsworthia]